MTGKPEDQAMSEPLESRLRGYFRSIDTEPPAGLEARVDRALDRAPTGTGGRGPAFLRGRDWQQFGAMAAAAVIVLVAAALLATSSYLGPGPSPSGATGPSEAPSAVETSAPSGEIPSAAESPSAGISAGASITAGPSVTPTPTPRPTSTPTPAATADRGASNLVSLPAMAPYLTGPAVNLDGVHILVAGGMAPNSDGVRLKTDIAEIFDESTHRWTATASMHDARYDHTMTLLRDGRVLVTGGADLMDGIDNLATAEIYDPYTGEWTYTGSMSRGRAAHCATLLVDGRVLITGGFGGGTEPTAAAEIYDPASGQFTPTGSMSVARMNHTATLLPGGRVLITGGVDDMSNVLDSAETWDPATGRFTPTGSMTTQREWHTATSLGDDRVLVVGGTGGSASGPAPLASAEIYDPATGRFTATGSMATARYEHTATLLIYGQVVVAGGNGTNSLEVYWPDTGRFGYARSLAGPVSAAVSMSDRVLLAGSPPQLYCSWTPATAPCQ